MPDLSLGANVVPGGVQFRVWAPAAKQVDLVILPLPEGAAVPPASLPMDRGDNGVWTLRLEAAQPGLRYKYRLDSAGEYPDPYSRFQPEGVHGPSEVVDPQDYQWRDQSWPGLDARDLAIYECHIGAFTPGGTFEAAIEKLPYLKSLGVTALEIMPVAEFSGVRNWGYDGVDWFAPSRAYGGPAGLRRLVDAAHQHGLGILLDVVYNHFGPEGNYLRQFSPDYFTSRYNTPWGDAINYEGCACARKLAIDNALYWLREFHIDGLRLDATFAIHDASAQHLLSELAEAVRTEKPGAILIAETHENDVRYLKPLDAGGYGFDAVWTDDFHHALRRLVAGDHEGYYQDYAGSVEELARALNQGFLYEGQRSAYSGQPRGTPARDRPAWQFVYCIQNHDQVGNRACGDRLSDGLSPDLYRVASALLLLAPYAPMLFMGQEFAAPSPFQYFTDHSRELGKLVTEGRRAEFKSFAAFSDPDARRRIPDPQAEKTFLDAKLPWQEAQSSPVLRLYQECLRLRCEDPVLRRHDRFSMQATAIADSVLALSFGDDRLLLANFAERTTIPAQRRTSILLDTNDPRFAGSAGEATGVTPSGIDLPARTAVLLG
ncbi:MAG TPA: malto-oligosyltrehalose trehalohydrolase [Chloroflexota bacterium]|nr:malto-oligosyltrehalose trehalohydrolase [Chloroflexota bacterium]